MAVGIRQGCPRSSTFFAFAVDPLVRAMLASATLQPARIYLFTHLGVQLRAIRCACLRCGHRRRTWQNDEAWFRRRAARALAQHISRRLLGYWLPRVIGYGSSSAFRGRADMRPGRGGCAPRRDEALLSARLWASTSASDALQRDRSATGCYRPWKKRAVSRLLAWMRRRGM